MDAAALPVPASLPFPIGDPSPYRWLALAGIAASLILWRRLARRDARLLAIYFCALLGASLGAALVYFAAEGWRFMDAPDRWRIWINGKSILGALLGGYAAVEGAKRALGDRRVTGDFFAGVVPLGVAFGRVGCLLHGCCLGVRCDPAAWYAFRDVEGVPRWPAVPVELGFNVAAVFLFWRLRRRRILPGQHFHLYLIAYGLFRFGHEFLRGTPKLAVGFSGYQIAALAVAVVGIAGFLRRRAPNPLHHPTLRLDPSA